MPSCRFLPALFLPLALFFAGCGSCPEKTALSKAWRTVGPEYRAYVSTDPTLDDFKKNVRRETCDALDAMFAAGEPK